MTPFPVKAEPMTGQHVVTALTSGGTSLLMSWWLLVQGPPNGEIGDFRYDSAQKSSFPVQGVMGGELNT